MPKLYFRYGTMNASKTANLLMVSHNYISQNKKVILMKPKIDNRSFDLENNCNKIYISSRTGMKKECDILIDDNFNIIDYDFTDIYCVLVDECQFLTKSNVNMLRELSLKIPVICYGLRTDFMSNLFEGSKRLMEIADEIEEIKTICTICDKKSIINAKVINNKVIKEDSNIIDLGFEDKYQSMCYSCWKRL